MNTTKLFLSFVMVFCYNYYHGVFLLITLTMTGVPAVDAFAAWLVESEVGCMTYLEKGEIIMNHQVVEASEAKVKGVFLKLLRNNQPINDVQEEEDSRDVIMVEAGEILQVEFTFPSSSSTQQLADVQYVLESTKGGTFINPSKVGCNGLRISGRVSKRPQGGNILATLKLSLSSEEETVELIGGWAAGHEAVKLTPKVVLKVVPKQQISNFDLDAYDDDTTEDQEEQDL